MPRTQPFSHKPSTGSPPIPATWPSPIPVTSITSASNIAWSSTIPSSGSDSTDQSGTRFRRSIGLVGALLGLVSLGLVYFLCRKRLSKYDENQNGTTPRPPPLPEVYSIPLDGRYVSRDHVERAAPGVVTPACIGNADLPPPYSSLELPPPYASVVLKAEGNPESEEFWRPDRVQRT